jgi:dUTP pyrophosphatase
MRLKVKRLNSSAVIPTKAHADDVGFDLVATSIEVVDKGEYGYIEYGTGIAIEPEDGYHVEVLPRSSISKTGLLLANCICLIDPGYRGEIVMRFKHIPKTSMYKIGDRIGQLVVRKTEQVQTHEVINLSDSERGESGFGSTGS